MVDLDAAVTVEMIFLQVENRRRLKCVRRERRRLKLK